MIAPKSELTPEQRALQALALKQLEAVQGTMKRLQDIPASQADREALADSAELVERGAVVLRDWFGDEPPNRFQ